ncbi:MAG TPA: DNA glycosylase [Chthoniobacterales bacterium]|nr:DNA glycosylase [Chthoniobacterales bacterium]
MILTRLGAPDFDLAQTLDSGQVFYWQALGPGYAGMIGDLAVYMEQRGDQLLVTRGAATAARRYFALDHPLREICAAFPRDPALDAARVYCAGLRIMRQPLWECLASFITSSMKQVAHIRQMSRALRERWGEPHALGDLRLYSFPSAARVAEVTEKELRACGLGYRAKNLLGTARLIAAGEANLESWRHEADDELRARLCALPGVGPKVANCVMLFAYERLRAFPIDVWIERVLKEQYFPRARKLTAARLRTFCQEYFGVQGGYAQQYLFHHARKTAVRTRRQAGT